MNHFTTFPLILISGQENRMNLPNPTQVKTTQSIRTSSIVAIRSSHYRHNEDELATEIFVHPFGKYATPLKTADVAKMIGFDSDPEVVNFKNVLYFKKAQITAMIATFSDDEFEDSATEIHLGETEFMVNIDISFFKSNYQL